MADNNDLIVHVLTECKAQLLTSLSPDSTVNYFWNRGLISDEEMHVIRKNGGSRKGQNEQFLGILGTKSNDLLDELIEFLSFDQNKHHLVNLLKNSKRKYAGGGDFEAEAGYVAHDDDGDFKLTYKRAAKITTILTEHVDILRDWDQIVNRFITKAIDLYEINSLDHPHRKIFTTLNKWISNSGNATFELLTQLLHGYDGAVDDLERKKDEIKSCDTFC